MLRVFENINNLTIELLHSRFSTVEQLDLRHITNEDGTTVSHVLIVSDLTDAEIKNLLIPITANEAAEVSNHHITRAALKAQVDAAIARLTQIETASPPFTAAGWAQAVKAIQDMATYEKKIIKVLARII